MGLENLTQTLLADSRDSLTLIAAYKQVLNLENINPKVRCAQYAVRGELAVMSEKYRHELLENPNCKLPFDKVISANIGNPQQLDQKPITFFRQVLSLLEYPDLINWEGEAGQKRKELVTALYPEDVIERARTLLKEIGSVGAYSQSQGAYGIRKTVAKFIEGGVLSRIAQATLTVSLRTRWIPCGP